MMSDAGSSILANLCARRARCGCEGLGGTERRAKPPRPLYVPHPLVSFESEASDVSLSERHGTCHESRLQEGFAALVSRRPLPGFVVANETRSAAWLGELL